MITDAIIAVFGFIAGGVAALLPTFTLPAWVDASVATVQGGLGFVEGFGLWMPLGAFRDGVVFVAGCMALVVAVKLVRIAASLFTGGGGSAA